MKGGGECSAKENLQHTKEPAPRDVCGKLIKKKKDVYTMKGHLQPKTV